MDHAKLILKLTYENLKCKVIYKSCTPHYSIFFILSFFGGIKKIIFKYYVCGILFKIVLLGFLLHIVPLQYGEHGLAMLESLGARTGVLLLLQHACCCHFKKAFY